MNFALKKAYIQFITILIMIEIWLQLELSA